VSCRLWLGLVVLLGAGLTCWLCCPINRAPATSLPVPTEPTGALQVQGIGYVEPASEIRKLAPRTGGVVRRLHVRVGEAVRQGQVLLELDNAVPQAEVETARSALALARAEAADTSSGINPYRVLVVEASIARLREKCRYCRVEVERQQKLLQGHAGNDQELQAALHQQRLAEAALREEEANLLYLHRYVTPEKRGALDSKIHQAEAQLKLAEEREQATRLLAPSDGTVLKLLKREGEGVHPSDPEAVLLFGDLSRLHVRADIDERFVQLLRAGQSAEISGRNLAGERYRSRVLCVEPLMGGKTVFTRASSEKKDLDVVQVILETEPGFRAPPGLRVDVEITVR
jgi:multidrug resistance efflux pump